MTPRLETALRRLEALPADEQEALAARIVDNLAPTEPVALDLPAYHYRAFIIYSRADRPAAVDIHARPVKSVFRDEDELVPGQDLPARIRLGLKQSEYLIVLCSPHAAASEWVRREILDFIELGRRADILAVVVDGEPGNPDRECLPEPLRFEAELEAGAARISTRPAVPLWVNARTGLGRDRPAFLRIIAALLALSSLDELIRRDRARRLHAIAYAGSAAIALAIIGLALQSHSTAIRKMNTLVSLARPAWNDGNWESAARFALIGAKGTTVRLAGFDPRPAENILMAALLHNRRIGTPRDLNVPDGAPAALSSRRRNRRRRRRQG